MRPEEASRLHPLLTTALSSASEGLSNNVAPAHAAEAAQRRESAQLDVDAGADATPSSSLSGSTSSGDLTPCLLISDSGDSDSATGSSAAAISCHSLTTQTSVPLTEPSQHQPTLGSSSPSSGSASISVVFNISPIKLHMAISSGAPAPVPAPACREPREAKAAATNTPAAPATASAGCQADLQARLPAVDASTDTAVAPTSRILGLIRPTRIPASPRDSTAAPPLPSPAAAAAPPPFLHCAPAPAHLVAPAPASQAAVTPSSASRAALELLMKRRALAPPAPAGLLLPSPEPPQTANITPAALNLSLCCMPPPNARSGCGVCAKAGARAEAQEAAARAHAQRELEAANRLHSASEARLQRQIESLMQQLAESRREAEALSRADAARRAAEAAALALGESSSPILDQLAAAKTGGRVSSFSELCGDGATQADRAAAAEVVAALQSTLSFAQDVVAGGALLLDRAPCGSTPEDEEARRWLAAGSSNCNNTLSPVKGSVAKSLEASALSADVSNSSGKVASGGSVIVLHTPLRTRSSRAITSSGTSAAVSSGGACITCASSGPSCGPHTATSTGSGSVARAEGGISGPALSPLPEERLSGAPLPCAASLGRALSLGSSQPAVPREAPIEVAATLPAGGFDTARWGRCISELGAQTARGAAACDEGTQTECTSHGRGGSGRVEVGWLGARLSVSSSSLDAVPL